MRTVRSGTVESFCIRTQKQWENEIALLLKRDSILQGMLTMLALSIICLFIINYVRLLSVILIIMAFALHAFTSRSTEQCKLLQKKGSSGFERWDSTAARNIV